MRFTTCSNGSCIQYDRTFAHLCDLIFPPIHANQISTCFTWNVVWHVTEAGFMQIIELIKHVFITLLVERLCDCPQICNCSFCWVFKLKDIKMWHDGILRMVGFMLAIFSKKISLPFPHECEKHTCTTPFLMPLKYTPFDTSLRSCPDQI